MNTNFKPFFSLGNTGLNININSLSFIGVTAAGVITNNSSGLCSSRLIQNSDIQNNSITSDKIVFNFENQGQGTQGAPGSQGSQGAQGSPGTQGAIGTTGVTGIRGATGSTGDFGTQGRTGIVLGRTGSTGFVGNPGAKGVAGVQGLQGFSSALTGSQGAQGFAGSQGAQGVSSGVQGSTGSTGAQGFKGAQGARGETGDTGLQGLIGTTGVTGTQGSTGSQGAPAPTPSLSESSQGVYAINDNSSEFIYLVGVTGLGTTTNLIADTVTGPLSYTPSTSKLSLSGVNTTGTSTINNLSLSGTMKLKVSSTINLTNASSPFNITLPLSNMYLISATGLPDRHIIIPNVSSSYIGTYLIFSIFSNTNNANVYIQDPVNGIAVTRRVVSNNDSQDYLPQQILGNLMILLFNGTYWHILKY